jgi:hypothetical protein
MGGDFTRLAGSGKAPPTRVLAFDPNGIMKPGKVFD